MTTSEQSDPVEVEREIELLVAGFASALRDKLIAAERKYGHRNAWKRDDWADDLRAELVRHVAKGDPRDVAAYCAFAWHHGWSLSASAQAGWVMVPREPTEEMLKAFYDSMRREHGLSVSDGYMLRTYARMLAASPREKGATCS